MTNQGVEMLVLSKKEFKRLIFVEYRSVGKNIFSDGLNKIKAFKIKFNNQLKYMEKIKEKEDLFLSPKVIKIINS